MLKCILYILLLLLIVVVHIIYCVVVYIINMYVLYYLLTLFNNRSIRCNTCTSLINSNIILPIVFESIVN